MRVHVVSIRTLRNLAFRWNELVLTRHNDKKTGKVNLQLYDRNHKDTAARYATRYMDSNKADEIYSQIFNSRL